MSAVLASALTMMVPPTRERWLVVALFAALVLQLGYGLYSDGATADEVTYIGSGFRHLHGDFRIDPDHPPLAKMIGALPLLGLRPAMEEVRPDDDQDGWSYRFIQQRNASLSIVRVARVSALVLTLLFVGLLWAWARAVGGADAGLLALASAAFQPGFLAHGHLVTMDMACAFFMLLSSWCYWRFERRPDAWRAVALALSLACAWLSRSTTLVLLPILVVLVSVRWVARRDGRAAWGRAVLSLLVAGVLIVPLVIWGIYGFRYAPWSGDAGTFGGPWPDGASGLLLRSVADRHLLPQAYIEGLRFQLQHQAGGHPSYLLGERSKEGWWYYFLVVVLVKNTLAFLLLLVVAAVAAARRLGDGHRAWRHWLVPAAIIFVAASAARVQLGERYILPVYAYLILWMASVLAPLAASTRLRRGLAAIVLTHALSTTLAAPRGYLAYFNAIGGGADGGHRWLADSNLDWGQDLPRLARWMRAQGVARIQLGYFGADDPDRYGIVHDDLPDWHSHHSVHAPAAPFHGIVVLSPNLALGYLFPPGRSPYEFLRGRAPDRRAGIFFVYDLR